MSLGLIAAGIALGVWLMKDDNSSAPTKPQTSAARQQAINLIRAEAEKQGLPPHLALAIAEVESNFNPRAAGDLHWAAKRPELYKKLVLDAPARRNNQARLDPSLWHSYGLFQLLAPHHARPTEHPAVLYDPQVNAQRGIAYLKSLMAKHGDDVAQVRLAYAGALKANAAEQERVLARFVKAYQAWAEREGST